MKIKCLESGKLLDVSASYGARLIEQGKAVLLPKTSKTAAPKKQVNKDVVSG